MTRDEEIEALRPVVGFPGYAVDMSGNVYSWRRSRCGRRVLRPSINRKGYKVVHLYADGRRRLRCVHRLVAESFIGPCPEGLAVRHLDGNRTNNTASNLAYGTSAENAADAMAHGTFSRGERHGNAKLDAGKVHEILRMIASGTSQRQAARRFGVHQTAVSQVVRGKTWRHAILPHYAATLKERKEKADG